MLPGQFKRNVYDQNFYWGGGVEWPEWEGVTVKNASSGVVGVGGHKKLFIGGEGTEGATTSPPPPKLLTVQNPMGCIHIPLSQLLEMRLLCTFSQFH